MASQIEHIYGARSEPATAFTQFRALGHDTLKDDSDEIDWIIVGNSRAVAIERKEASDFLRSFIDANEISGEPRVMAQLRRLKEFKDENNWPTLCVLLIERTIGQNRAGYATVDGGLIATKIPYNAIDNFLMVIQHWGIRVAHSTSLAHTPARIVSIAEGWLSAEDKEPILMLPKAAPAQLRTPMTMPGLGIKRSKALFKQYSNLRTLLQALLDDDTDSLDIGIRTKVKDYLDKTVLIREKPLPITRTDNG